jgi:transposase-like protein
VTPAPRGARRGQSPKLFAFVFPEKTSPNMIAADLRKRRPKPHTTWHLDEVYLKIAGRMVYSARSSVWWNIGSLLPLRLSK